MEGELLAGRTVAGQGPEGGTGSRRGEAYTAFALVLTFALGGLWHGANWTFVLWGVVNGLGLVAVRLWSRAGC